PDRDARRRPIERALRVPQLRFVRLARAELGLRGTELFFRAEDRRRKTRRFFRQLAALAFFLPRDFGGELVREARGFVAFALRGLARELGGHALLVRAAQLFVEAADLGREETLGARDHLGLDAVLPRD